MSKVIFSFLCAASFAFAQTTTIDSIEINQGIGKQLNGAASFVAGKTTAVRAFLTTPGAVDASQTRAVIVRDGTTVATLTPQNYDQPTGVVDFLCPSLDACGSWAAGSYVFNVTVNGASKSTQGTTLAFVERKKLRVLARAVRVSFSGTVKSVPDQSWKMFWTFTRAVYPIPDNGLTWVTQDEMDLSNLNLDTTEGGRALWQALTDLQPKECAVNPKGPTCFDLIVGFIGQNPKDPETGSSLAGFTYGRPTSIVVATDPDAAASVAHEIAHTFGIGDTYNAGSINCVVNPAPDAFAGQDFTDPTKPAKCTAGRLAYAPSNSGTLVPASSNPYEVGGRGALPDMVDYMGSGTTLAPKEVIWTSPDAYQKLFTGLVPDSPATQRAQAAARLATPVPVADFSGYVDAAGNVTLIPWKTFTSADPLPSITGAYTVRAVDSTGTVLATQGFDVQFYVRSNPPKTVKLAPFEGSIAFPANTAKFQILKGTSVLKELIVSKNAPVVNSVLITQPSSGTIVANGTITWTASDADGDKLTYDVYYDPDMTNPDGDVELLASNVTGTFLTYDFSKLPGGNHAGILVEANDGLMIGFRASAEFKVPFKRPEVMIEPLQKGPDFSTADAITLSGFAFDAQDELVDAGSLVWSSSISGRLGTGETLSVKLPAGEHLVTLTATNKAGLSSSATLTVRVGARSAVFATTPQITATTLTNTFGSSTVSAQIAAGALSSPAKVSLDNTASPANAVAPAGLFFAGFNFDLAIAPTEGAAVTTLPAGITLNIGYSAAGDATTIRLFRWDAATSKWIDAATECQPASTYDRSVAGKIGVKVCRTGSFALAGIIQPAARTGGVTNGASGLASAISPGAFVSIYGSNLSVATVQNDGASLANKLSGVSVTVNGTLAAPLYYVSPGQLNIQLPFETPLGAATLTVTRDGLTGPAIAFNVIAAGPGILVFGDNRAVAVNVDNGLVNTAQNPAKVGSFLTLYMTGQGALDRAIATGQPAPLSPTVNVLAKVTATIGGVDALVTFAGMAPTFVGLTQVNMVVPAVAGGDQPLRVTIGGTLSNSALLTVQP